jgi:hypothetical protein
MGQAETIPGYREAVEKERNNRDLAFCLLPIPVCGLLSHFLTPATYIRLWGCDNAFIHGREPTAEDVAMFLWFISPGYSIDAGERHRFIKHRVASLNAQQVVGDIYAFLAVNFQDSLGGDSGAEGMRKSYTSGIASIVDVLASEYGWSDLAILNMPFPRIYQYLRRIQIRNNPGAPLFNPSDAVLAKWLQSRNAAH